MKMRSRIEMIQTFLKRTAVTIYLILATSILSFATQGPNKERIMQPGPGSAILKIGTAHGSSKELAAKAQLERIIKSSSIAKWMFTDTVTIDETAIPHSHPTLTLNTRYLEDDAAQLATLLHEQFHWMLTTYPKQLKVAMQRFESIYPDMPESLPEGSRGKHSGYLHLVVCYLELEAMKSIFGNTKARYVLQSWKHYTWIYSKVLNDPQVATVIEESGIRLP